MGGQEAADVGLQGRAGILVDVDQIVVIGVVDGLEEALELLGVAMNQDEIGDQADAPE